MTHYSYMIAFQVKCSVMDYNLKFSNYITITNLSNSQLSQHFWGSCLLILGSFYGFIRDSGVGLVSLLQGLKMLELFKGTFNGV